METSLHRQLKERYGPEAGGRLEVTLEGFRIDAVAADGALIEVQSGALGPLLAKLRRPGDLWSLLPAGLPETFTTRELADRLGRPLPFAQRVAYCLRHAGAAEVVGKRGNHRVYLRDRG